MKENKENIKNSKTQKNIEKNKTQKVIKIIFIILVSLFILYEVFANIVDINTLPYGGGGMEIKKPIIYLYPTEKSDINVKLEYKGKIFADYPKYNESIKGWKVTANPDGKLINHEDNREYSYIFWEGYPEKEINWDLSNGFVVKGEDTVEFLQEKLSKLGLTPEEYNEFIVYWFPLMQDNKYNLIHFADEQYTNTAPLDITPEPDSMLRVFMVYKPLEEYIEIEEQEIQSFERKGFTVIEWGGTEVK
ncbi:MAG: hypothetical protein QM490_01440 [Candidatus Gracilibacteria bacterium]